VTETTLLGVPPLLSPEEPISWEYLSYPLLSSGLTMGVGPSKIPSDFPLRCLLAHLGTLPLMPDLKPQKLIFLWPQYPLDNASKWPLSGTFNPNILRDLYNFCEHAGEWEYPTFNPCPISAPNSSSVLPVSLLRFY
jgi:hypothetical protein